MDFKNLNVLIIDDAQLMLDTLETILYEIGVNTVEQRNTGKDILNYLEGKNINFIICDQVMNEQTGIETLIEIRTKYDKKEIPFILLTSEGNRKNIVSLLANGGNHFIPKPPSSKLMQEKIQEVFKQLEK